MGASGIKAFFLLFLELQGMIPSSASGGCAPPDPHACDLLLRGTQPGTATSTSAPPTFRPSTAHVK